VKENRSTHLIQVSTIVIGNENTGIISKGYDIRNFIDCYRKIIDRYVKSNGPKTKPCGTPCLIVLQLQNPF
jgi:hypothetical protein